MADVRWNVNVDVPTGKAKSADTVFERMEQHLQRLDSTVGHLAGHFDELGGHAERAGHHSESMFKEIFSAELAKDAVEKLTEKVIELGKEALKSAASEQRMMRVFEANFGSKEAGEAAEKWADALALKTELSERQTEGALIGMKRAGASDQEAKLATKAAADIAAVSENKDEAFAATMEAFERINRTGVISPRALAPLGLGVKDFKSLPSMAGLSDKAIKKKMEEGKVDRDDLYRLILSRTGEKAIGERAANNADLLTTKLAKLSELPERFFKKLAETGAINTLSLALDRVLTKLDPDSPTGKRIAGFLEGAFEAAVGAVDKVVDAMDGIDFEVVADGVTGFVMGMKEVLGVAIQVVEVLGDIAKKVAEVSGLNDFFADVMHKRKQAHEIAEAKAAILAGKEVPRNETTIQAGLVPRGELVKPGVRAWHGQFHMAGEDAAAGAVAAAGDFVTAGEKWGQSVEKGYRTATKTHSPSVLFEDMGAMAAAGFVSGIDHSMGDVDGAMERAFAGRDTAPGRAGGAGVSMTFGDVIIHVDGARSDAREQGKQAADAFDKELRARMTSLFDQLRVARGV